MSAPTATPAPASRTVTIGDRELVIERPSGRKAGRALALVRSTSGLARELVHEWGRFEQEYAASHTIELTRAEARRRFQPEPLVDIKLDGTQEPVFYPEGHARAGELVMIDPLASMTEEDWQASGNTYRLQQRPPRNETIAALMDFALERAEDTVYRLIALFTMSNEEVTAAWKSGGDRYLEVLDQRVDYLLDDCFADELVEIAVVAGEVIDGTFRRKLEAIGKERLGNALRLLGLDLTPSTPEPDTTTQTPEADAQTTSSSSVGDSSSTLTPSSDSPSPTDGASTPPSTPRTTSSSSSPPDSSPESSEPSPSDGANPPASVAAASSPAPEISSATSPASA